MKPVKTLITLTLISTMSASLACSPKEFFIGHFPTNSTQLPNSEILRLANWAVDLKIHYRNHISEESSEIYGSALSTEENAAELSHKRLTYGVATLEKLGVMRGTIYTGAYIYTPQQAPDGPRLEIQFTPQCPNKCGPCE